jgi:2-polyprenyl-3-methyl-5-hydroxy-6-metoxy-1,4-benzoquinol methylase
MPKIKTKDLVKYLRKTYLKISFVNRLKVSYRPLICPFDELLDLIPENARIFDIGSGSGQFCLLVAEFTKAESIHGIEISADLVSNATQLLKDYSSSGKIHFEQYDGLNIPEIISESDYIFLIDVLHHIPLDKQYSFLKELHKKIAVNTKVIIKDIDADSLFVYANKFHDLVFSGEIGNEASSSELWNHLAEIGFEILSSSGRRMLWYPHYTVIAKKIAPV